MIVITDKQREQINEALHDEIVQEMKQGDTSVLFQIIQQLNHTTAFYSLSEKKLNELGFSL